MSNMEETVQAELTVEHDELEAKWRAQFTPAMQAAVDAQAGSYGDRPAYREWTDEDEAWHSRLLNTDYAVHPPLPNVRCKGRPKLWNEDYGNNEVLESFNSQAVSRKTVWSHCGDDAIDITQPLQWLARREIGGIH